MADHSRLGRGLAALIGDVGEESNTAATPEASRKPRRAPIETLKPNPRNPRRTFTEAELAELSDSIKERGIIQPIVVREVPNERDSYEIIAGERRWRAAQRAGLHEVPIAIVDATDTQSLEFAIIENVQRADLNPIEEAAGYVALMEQCNHTQEQVAQIIGKSRPYIANLVRLLKLPDQVKRWVREGKLSAGHARLLVGHPNAELFASMAIEEGYSVRQLEEWVRQEEQGQPGDKTFDGIKKKIEQKLGKAEAPKKDPDTLALERRMSDILGLDVSVDHQGDGGTLHIKYTDLDQLDAVLRKLGG
ncbi:ParB/RepB/Spo0J family partition protein [Pseudolabrys taiwanensis]|uniref:ParB/RepB/Spo0J family partition protein n=1 Tax=Pseudolabrys taiwanensis TaxID=331696 RepID=A0A345ZZU9_9HYPH|nr:ParB/RepB/Spo0J family partition protein [Pseudolabrys taiwanensis]AXK82446.1 ParB/RepB/Spo0J family partition protein [Pseudolabrys taiwanensis]